MPSVLVIFYKFSEDRFKTVLWTPILFLKQILCFIQGGPYKTSKFQTTARYRHFNSDLYFFSSNI